MHHLLAMSALALFVHLAEPASAEQITWENLIDQAAHDYDDPFAGLDFDQLDDLRVVVRETARLANGAVAGDDRLASEQKLADARSRLEQGGIDPDWLIGQRWIVAEKRKRAATAVNAKLDGETVTLGGFAIPAPPADDGTRVVYLVPERGMCSHTPPPNSNQMIRARLTGDWSPATIHEPVRLTGKLIAKETQHSFRIVDGEVPMRSSFVMEVTEVQPMQAFHSGAQQTNEWAAGLAARLRTAGQLPGNTAEADK